MRTPVAAAALSFVLAAGAASVAQGASYRSCQPVKNPYPGTRYEGVDLSQIRALRVSCTTARRVARGAHRKALGITPPPSGVRTLTWNGWRIRGDLRPNSDRYLATKGSRRVRWRF